MILWLNKKQKIIVILIMKTKYIAINNVKKFILKDL